MKRSIQQRWEKFQTKRLPVICSRWLSALPVILMSLILLLRTRPQLLGTGYSQTAAEVLDNLEDAILRVKRSYTARELEPFLETDDAFRTFGRLQDSLYFNTLAVNCLHTLQEMHELAAQPKE